MRHEAVGLTIIRILIGIFLVVEGLQKLSWLGDPALLATRLAGWNENAPAVSRWYLEHVAIPGVPVFARVVVAGELLGGLALVAGFWTRAVAVLAFLMVLNYHVASGLVFRTAFLTNGYALPVLGSLLGLAIGGRRLPWSIRG